MDTIDLIAHGLIISNQLQQLGILYGYPIPHINLHIEI
jgi:hypothetical protein